MALKIKVEVEVDIDKLLKQKVADEFGSSAKITSMRVDEPAKKQVATARTTPKTVAKKPAPKKAPTKK